MVVRDIYLHHLKILNLIFDKTMENLHKETLVKQAKKWLGSIAERDHRQYSFSYRDCDVQVKNKMTITEVVAQMETIDLRHKQKTQEIITRYKKLYCCNA